MRTVTIQISDYQNLFTEGRNALTMPIENLDIFSYEFFSDFFYF